MSQVKQIDIKCLKPECSNWFPSPIAFGNTTSFETATMSGNTAQCPYCGSMTPCNKENMRLRTVDSSSGFVGDDT